MSEPAIRRMTTEEFLDWEAQQEFRHELVDGVPVAMTGAMQRHDLIVVNALVGLGSALRGRACRPFTADIGVVVPAGNIRRPDAGVHCPPFDDRSMLTDHPRVVVEVLSASTRFTDQLRKLEEYQSIASMDWIVIVEPDTPRVLLWSRGAQGRAMRSLDSLAEVIDMPALDIAIPLSELYQGVTFAPRARLVQEPQA